MKQIQGPDGVVIEFPDNMDDAAILGVMRKTYGGAKPPSTAMDVAKSAGVGVGQGAIDVLGTPADITGLMAGGVDWLVDKGIDMGRSALGMEPVTPEEKARKQAKLDAARSFGLPGSETITNAVKSVTGDFYKPQTTAGKYANTATRFATSAALTPGASVGSVIGYGVLPGIASEAAGQATEGTGYEPYARGAAAIATGGTAALVNRPDYATRMIADNMRGVDPQTIQAARQLMDDAATRGVQLTTAEALQQVTQGAMPGMSRVQRLVEGTPSGQAELGPVMAARPDAVRNAATQSLDTVAPLQRDPSMLGPRVQEAAQGTLDNTRGAINRLADPYYRAAENVRIPAADFAQIQNVPGFAGALAEVRNNPQLNRYVANLPDDSVGVLNEVKKLLDTNAANAGNPLNANRNNQIAAGLGNDATTVRQTAINNSPEYGQALNIEQQGREQVLRPMEAGPVGRMARTDTTESQIGNIMPTNPLAGSEQEVAQASAALNRAQPGLAEALMRQGMQRKLNESTQDLAGGPNQFGGARFRAEVAGNPQQRENMAAALQATGNQGALDDVNRTLDILQATGWRERPGSQTAFNNLGLEDMKGGGVGAPVKAGANPIAAVRDAYSRHRINQNSMRLAEALIGPAAFDRLLHTPGGVDAINRLIMSRVLMNTNTAANSAASP